MSSMRSMTGFGRASFSGTQAEFEIEIRCVNHRFFDLSLKLPQVLQVYETDLREILRNGIQRGRAEVTINYLPNSKNETGQFDQAAFDKLKDYYTLAFNQLKTDLSQYSEDTRTQLALTLLSRREVLNVSESSTLKDRSIPSLEQVTIALKEAISGLNQMRLAEGAHLAQDLTQRITHTQQLMLKIKELSLKNTQQIKQRLLDRITKLDPDLKFEESRMMQEVLVLCDRSDITEELVRLDSHINNFVLNIGQDQSGKKFDFLLQEIQREFTTLSGKSQSAEIQGFVIEAKIEIEKMREQIQNLI